ncbi:MAG: MCE family protein [Candidatus Omnitrophica bacterium]|nr:MCE family protein [Candidatus Omnitrophota bacterium]
MAKILTDEVKTGFVVILCLTILVVLTVSVGKISVFNKQYKLKVTFSQVAGLENSAPVRLSGVDAGKVESVDLIYKDGKTIVMLELLMNGHAKPRVDSKAYVTTLGLMGEKYVELTAGSEGKPFLKPGTTIVGTDPIPMEKLMEMAEKVVNDVEVTLKHISSLSMHLDELVVENRENIDDILGNLTRTSQNFEEFSDDIKKNPWKLLMKGRDESTKEKRDRRDRNRR